MADQEKTIKTYYLSPGAPGIPASMCTGVPGEGSWYPARGDVTTRWIKLSDARATIETLCEVALEAGEKLNQEYGDYLSYSKIADAIGELEAAFGDLHPRYVVRRCGPGYEWLPEFVVIDLHREVRVAAYSSEDDANEDCAERNRLVAAEQEPAPA